MKNAVRWWLVAGVSMAAVAGCLGPLPGDTEGFHGTDSSDPTSGANGEDGAGGSTAGSSGAPEGLPCEIATFLQTECVACHAAPSGAQPFLGSYDELIAPYGSVTSAEASLASMKNAQAPMPPTGLPSSADVAMFEAWIAKGMPMGDCGSEGAGAAGPTPFDGAVVCTSNEYWTNGTDGSQSMTPGQACIACHQGEDEGPDYVLAGTAYPTGHEPDDCFGTEGALIEVTDATGAVTTMTTNGAGNFSKEEANVVFPVTARVITDGGVMQKQMPVDHGDCNLCHTEAGDNGAPGRIVAL